MFWCFGGALTGGALCLKLYFSASKPVDRGKKKFGRYGESRVHVAKRGDGPATVCAFGRPCGPCQCRRRCVEVARGKVTAASDTGKTITVRYSDDGYQGQTRIANDQYGKRWVILKRDLVQAVI